MLRNDINQKAQSTIELAVLFTVVAVTIITMHLYVRRSLQGLFKTVERELNIEQNLEAEDRSNVEDQSN